MVGPRLIWPLPFHADRLDSYRLAVYDFDVTKRSKPRNLLAGHYGLGEMAKKKTGGISPSTVDLGIIGGGLVLGFVSFPYRDTPIGQTLMVAGGGLVAIAAVLLVRELLVGSHAQKAAA